MVIIRKGKKVYGEYPSAYEVADDVGTLGKLIPEAYIGQVQRLLRQNAFSLAIRGCKARLGGGVIVEAA